MGVVLIHSHITDGVVMNGVNVFSPVDFPAYRAVSNLLSDVFVRVAVPLSFLFPVSCFSINLRSRLPSIRIN